MTSGADCIRFGCALANIAENYNLRTFNSLPGAVGAFRVRVKKSVGAVSNVAIKQLDYELEISIFILFFYLIPYLSGCIQFSRASLNGALTRATYRVIVR